MPSSQRTRLPLPTFDVQSVDKPELSNNTDALLLHPPPSLSSSSSTQISESISTSSPTIEIHGDPVRLRYPKHNHVHLAQV